MQASPAQTQEHPHSECDQLADEYFAATLQLSPLLMTSLGIHERQSELDDFSPAGLEAQARLDQATLDKIESAQPSDEVDDITLAGLRERLDLAIRRHEAGDDRSTVNNIASGLHSIREGFDAMPTSTPGDWAMIAARLHAVPQAVDQWFMTQQSGLDYGLRPALRQVDQLATQVEGWVSEGGFFETLVNDARCSNGDELPRDIHSQLAEGVSVARHAYQQAAERLRNELRPVATTHDAVGIQRYQRASQEFIGSTIDLEATYRWGLDEVARIADQEREAASRIRSGASVTEALAFLDADPQYRLHGVDALQAWMQRKADEAIVVLNGKHFDIADPVRTIECRIAPTADGIIYYTAPSDDFSRPGRMWWSVPAGTEDFSTWRELTTVHHEGVPGHHLQLSQAIYRKDVLNTWRRNGCWVSGHGEGWALYAELLMAELNFMDDPGNLLGMLDSQMLRAVRVVIDIGMHCGFDAPAEAGGGPWTFDKAWSYFNRYVSMDEGFARFEVNRYFGWPGQAPSYKIGEHLWLTLRDELKNAEKDSFDLKAFHMRALNMGSLPLDVLREAMLNKLQY